MKKKLGRSVNDSELAQWYKQYANGKNRHVSYQTPNHSKHQGVGFFKANHTNHRGCGFLEANDWGNPQIKQGLEAYEHRLQEQIKARKAMGLAGRTMGEVYQIPVIVHIIHNGEPIGEGANISAAQVYSQIEVLNEDFRKRNADAANIRDAFADIQADAEIEFVIALEDPNGNPLPEPGITRSQGSQSVYTLEQFDALVKPFTQFDPFRYANFWTCNLEQGLLGYAQFPDDAGVAGIPFSGPANRDGVVMGYRYFGSIDKVVTPQLQEAGAFALGRTTTHEVGHWLGLRHISGDGNGDCSLDDFGG